MLSNIKFGVVIFTLNEIWPTHFKIKCVCVCFNANNISLLYLSYLYNVGVPIEKKPAPADHEFN